MARKKAEPEIITPAFIDDQRITDVLENNYMPYAMSIIVSRAIPDIDGFKPVHRKILYMMYKNGLLNSSTPRAKSSKVVGQVMMLHPHGDAAIYESIVRLTTDNESLLHPFVDSKGTWGKHYSDTAFAASRYTEIKLDKFCEEIFVGIDKDAVDFTDNFDGTMLEPTVLPTSFPNILVSSNSGIAVGMTSSICSFNLNEVCDATIAFLKNEKLTLDELLDIMPAPDFSTGAQIIYDRNKMREIYRTGVGSIPMRSKYSYDKKNNCVDVTEIPYTTTCEKIIEAIAKVVKEGKVKDISDVRDEIDIKGMRLTIDFKRGADYEKTMAKLLKMTPLENTFSCNFNILVGGTPSTLGVLQILDEWSAFRIECLRREYAFELNKTNEKLHLLYGLKKILLDIDKAIRIVRNTPNDKDVVPNLMKGFDIDKIQAEFVADIKLRHLNKEYVLDRISEIDDLEAKVRELEDLLSSNSKIKKVIIKQLTEIKKKYGKDRKTELIDASTLSIDTSFVVEVEDYPTSVFLSKDGYFKKCTPQSLRGNDVQKFKDGDELLYTTDISNRGEMLFFTSKAQVYKAKIDDFECVKASSLGEYIPVKLNFDPDERIVGGLATVEFDGNVVFFFENGKGVRFPLDNYKTKNNRKKLMAAFFEESLAVGIHKETKEYLLLSDNSKALLVKASQIPLKSTRTSSGSQLFSLKKDQKIIKAIPYDPDKNKLEKESKYRKSKLPATGVVFEDYDIEIAQQKMI